MLRRRFGTALMLIASLGMAGLAYTVYYKVCHPTFLQHAALSGNEVFG